MNKKDVIGQIKKNCKKILAAELLIILTALLVLAFEKEPLEVKAAQVISTKSSVIELAWNESENTDGYMIYRSENDGEREYLGSTTEAHFSDKSASSESNYTYYIVPRNGVKTGSESVISYKPTKEKSSVKTNAIFTSEDEAAEFLRESMVKRISNVTFDTSGFDVNTSNIFTKALWHTGTPNEGDYLKFQYGTSLARTSVNGNITTITYSIDYYSTAEQEEIVDKAVPAIISSLNLEGKTDHEKIEAIYKYLRDNIEYDHTDYEDNNIKRTAYAALIKGECVCQGYALAAYRLFLEAGIDSRIIYGLGVPELGPSAPHSWNIVKCDDIYYYLDITWDDSRGVFNFNMQPKEEFEETHIGLDEYANLDQIYTISETGYNADALSKNEIVFNLLALCDKSED